MPESLGLALSEESLKRLVPTKFARGAFLRQQPLGPVQTQALAEGTLRAEAAVKSQRLAQVQRIGIEKERIQVEREKIKEQRRRTASVLAEQKRAERQRKKESDRNFITKILFGT